MIPQHCKMSSDSFWFSRIWFFVLTSTQDEMKGKNDRDSKGVCLCPPVVLHIYDIIYCLFGSDCGRVCGWMLWITDRRTLCRCSYKLVSWRGDKPLTFSSAKKDTQLHAFEPGWWSDSYVCWSTSFYWIINFI